MNKLFYIMVTVFAVFALSACSYKQDSMDNMDSMHAKKQMKMTHKPKNIDENNVGITSGEAADQTDSTLIEGNLENNDFKN